MLPLNVHASSSSTCVGDESEGGGGWDGSEEESEKEKAAAELEGVGEGVGEGERGSYTSSLKESTSTNASPTMVLTECKIYTINSPSTYNGKKRKHVEFEKKSIHQGASQ